MDSKNFQSGLSDFTNRLSNTLGPDSPYGQFSQAVCDGLRDSHRLMVDAMKPFAGAASQLTDTMNPFSRTKREDSL
jgi:hypothetical protein